MMMMKKKQQQQQTNVNRKLSMKIKNVLRKNTKTMKIVGQLIEIFFFIHKHSRLNPKIENVYLLKMMKFFLVYQKKNVTGFYLLLFTINNRPILIISLHIHGRFLHRLQQLLISRQQHNNHHHHQDHPILMIVVINQIQAIQLNGIRNKKVYYLFIDLFIILGHLKNNFVR